MTADDFAGFTRALFHAAEVFAEPCSEARILAYFDTLKDLPLDWVLAGLREAERTSRFFPKPADIREHAQAQDGHLGPEQAWALVAQLGEDDTVVWTDEIARACGPVLVMIASGDRVGARMAFLEAYKAQLAKARAAGRPARWWPSLGHDPSQRAGVLAEAVAQGRLPAARVAAMLPPGTVEALPPAVKELVQQIGAHDAAPAPARS